MQERRRKKRPARELGVDHADRTTGRSGRTTTPCVYDSVHSSAASVAHDPPGTAGASHHLWPYCSSCLVRAVVLLAANASLEQAPIPLTTMMQAGVFELQVGENSMRGTLVVVVASADSRALSGKLATGNQRDPTTSAGKLQGDFRLHRPPVDGTVTTGHLRPQQKREVYDCKSALPVLLVSRRGDDKRFSGLAFGISRYGVEPHPSAPNESSREEHRKTRRSRRPPRVPRSAGRDWSPILTSGRRSLLAGRPICIVK
jgi:hypothetical protein